MAMKATELRNNLFQVLEGVANGKSVEVEYKGRRLRIVPDEKPDWKSLLVKRDIGGDMLEGVSGWSKEAQAEWEAEWREVLPKAPKAGK